MLLLHVGNLWGQTSAYEYDDDVQSNLESSVSWGLFLFLVVGLWVSFDYVPFFGAFVTFGHDASFKLPIIFEKFLFLDSYLFLRNIVKRF